MPDDAGNWTLPRIAERFGKVRLGQGVVGNTTGALIATVAAVAVGIWKGGAGGVTLGVLVVALYVYYFRETLRFADRHPDLALLGGATLAGHWRSESEIESKRRGSLAVAPLVSDPQQPAPETIADQRRTTLDASPAQLVGPDEEEGASEDEPETQS
jgi:hypothetical protein